MTKDAVLDVVNKMPEDFDLDMLVERLIFIERVSEGLAQIDNNEGVALDEVKQMVKEWQK